MNNSNEPESCKQSEQDSEPLDKKTPVIEIKSKRNNIGLLCVNSCYSVLSLFVGVFLVAQIFVITDESFAAVAMFALVELTMLFIFFTIACYLSKKIKPIYVTRFSALVMCGLLILIMAWEDGVYNYYLLFGAIKGIGSGLYWGANHTIVSQVLKRDFTITYFVWFLSIVTLVRVLFPFSFGFIIDFASFFVTTIVVLVIGVLLLLSTYLIKVEKPSGGHLRIRTYFRALKKAKFVKPSLSLWFLIFISGLAHTLGVAMTLLIVLVFGTNMSIGIFSSVFAALGIFVLILYKMSPKKWKYRSFWPAAIFPFAISFILLIELNIATIIIFQASWLLSRIPDVEEENTRLSATKYWQGHEFATESNWFYEFALWCGRVFSCLFVLSISWFANPELAFAVIIIIMTGLFAVHTLWLLMWKKKYVTCEID